MPIIPPIAPAPTIQIFTRWFLITKGDWSAHRSRAGYPGFCKGALTSRLVLDHGEVQPDPRKIGSSRGKRATHRLAYYPGKEVGQAFQPDKAQSQAGKPDLQCVSFVPG